MTRGHSVTMESVRCYLICDAFGVTACMYARFCRNKKFHVGNLAAGSSWTSQRKCVQNKISYNLKILS